MATTTRPMASGCKGLLTGSLAGSTMAKIRPTNNIKVFLDADLGISIDKCVSYNRALYKEIVESGIFPDGDFSLEVSSPGLEEPLKLRRQYQKNIGRNVEVMLKDGMRKDVLW